MSLSSNSSALAKPGFRLSLSKKDWKAKVKSHAGSSFDYTVEGWKASHGSYVSDTVTISVDVSPDCELKCSDDLCITRYFGKATNCRAERNVFNHLVAFHSPPVQPCIKEGEAQAETKRQAMLVSPKSQMSASHALDNDTNSIGNALESEENVTTVAEGANEGAGVPTTSQTVIGTNGFAGFGFTKRVIKSKEQKRMEREEQKRLSATVDLTGDSNRVFPTASVDCHHTFPGEDEDNCDEEQVDVAGESLEMESSSASDHADTADKMSEITNAVVTTGTSSAIGSTSVTTRGELQTIPKPPYWVHRLATKHAVHSVKNGDRDPIIPCRGVDLKLPEPAAFNFPVHIGFVVPKARTSFYFDSQDEVVRAWRCGRFEWKSDLDSDDDPNNYRCSLCRELKNDDVLQSTVERANDSELYKSHTKSQYLTFAQLQQRSLHHAGRCRGHLLNAFSSKKGVASLMRHRDESNALIVAISENKVARGQQLLAYLLKRGSSVNGMLETYLKAADGKYHHKLYSQDDMDEDFLAWKMGGARLAYAQNHSARTGGASINTIKRRFTIPKRYITMAAEIDLQSILTNFERFVVGRTDADQDLGTKCIWNVQVDDIKGEKRVRIDETDGKVRGLCYHAVKNKISLDIRCPDDCKILRQAFDDGKVHFAQEITNIALAPNREEFYEPKVVATSAGCRNNDPLERLERLISMTISVYVQHEQGQKARGVLSTVQPDGATAFVKIGHKLFFAEKMKECHPLYDILSRLPLFYLWTGTGDRTRVTMGCEMKHSFKRVRERIKSNVGCTFVAFQFTGSLLRELLLATGGEDVEINAMFATGYADAMNVPYMVKLFRALASLKDKQPRDFGKWEGTVKWCIDDIMLMSRFAELIATIVADKRPSLGEQLENISELMHLAFVIHRRNGTEWIAAQTYSNMQRLLKSIYWSLANAEVEGVNEYFIYQDSGDRLEMLYCIVRCLLGGASGNGTGVDVLQFGERVGGAMAVDSIYAQKPHLKKKSRHLATPSAAGSDDHQNPRSFLSTSDGKQDRSRIDVTSVNLLYRYLQGRSKAAAYLERSGYKAEEVDWDTIQKEHGVDLLRPHGEFVGIGKQDGEDDVPSEESIADEECEDSVEAALPDSVIIEEALGAVPEDGSCKATHLTKFDVGNGRTVSAAQCLRLAFAEKRQNATETSRVARNKGVAKSGTALKEDARTNYAAGDSYVIRAGEDPMVTLITTKHGVSQVIVMPERFVVKVGNKSTVLSSISVDHFKGKLIIRGSVIQPIFKEDDIVWAVGNRTRRKFDFYAKDASLINPEVICSGIDDATHERGDRSDAKQLQYVASQKTLGSVLHMLYLDHEGKDQSTKSVLPDLSDVRGVPYKHDGNIVFIAEGSCDRRIPSSRAKSAVARSTSKLIECGVPGCSEQFPAALFRQHAAYHLKHDKLLEKRVGTPVARLCGLCAVNAAVQYSADYDKIDGCAFWLEKPKGARSQKPRSYCKVVGDLRYSLAVASKHSRASPSTNVPIVCPECPTDPLPMCVWKYGMEDHYKRYHAGLKMSDALKEQLVVTDDELKGILRFRKTQQVRKRGRKRKSAPVDAVVDIEDDNDSNADIAEAGDNEKDDECASVQMEGDNTVEECGMKVNGDGGKYENVVIYEA